MPSYLLRSEVLALLRVRLSLQTASHLHTGKHYVRMSKMMFFAYKHSKVHLWDPAVCTKMSQSFMVLLELWETKRFFVPTKQSGTHVTLPCVVTGQRPFLFCGLPANAVQVFALGPTMKKFEEGDMLFWNLDTAGTLHLAPCLRERGL